MRVVAIIVSTFLFVHVLIAQPPRRLTAGDLQNIRAITSTALSPDSSKVLYTLEESDLKQNVRLQSIWLITLKDKHSSRVVDDSIPSSPPPQWSSDGNRFAYLSKRDGKTQVCVVEPQSGLSTTLTNATADVDSFAWSPDTKTVAYVFAKPGPASSIEGVRVVSNEKPPTVELHLIDTASKQDRLINLREGFAPENLSWSPDSNEIAFSSSSNIYAVRVGDNVLRTIVDRPGNDIRPSWSPDGKQIAFISNYGRETGTKISISVVNAVGDPKPIDRYKELDFGFGGYPPWFMGWSTDSKSLFVSVLSRMTQNLFSLSLADGAITRITQGDNKVFHDFSFSADRSTFSFIMTDPITPGEIYVSSTQNFAPTQLTQKTNPGITALNVLKPETVRWKSTDGTEVEGLLLKPAGYDPSKKYPLLVQMEGSYGTYDLSFTGRVSADTAGAVFPYQQQVFAAKGYVVLMPNPRGSWGYGETFRLLGRKEYGPGPYNDIITGVDHLIASGIADPDRLGIMGIGFDGYRTAFAISQSNRFKAASIGQVMGFDLASWYGQADSYQDFLEVKLGGPPWKVPENYARISPWTFAGNIKTPTLVFHLEIPSMSWSLGQSQELYTVLRKNNVPVEYAIYSLINNDLRPKSMGDIMQRNLDWFEKWIKTD